MFWGLVLLQLCYIDAVVLRQKDDNSGWTNAADGTLEQRYYYCQNWRADVSAIVNGSGMMMAWINRFRQKVYGNNCTTALFLLKSHVLNVVRYATLVRLRRITSLVQIVLHSLFILVYVHLHR